MNGASLPIIDENAEIFEGWLHVRETTKAVEEKLFGAPTMKPLPNWEPQFILIDTTLRALKHFRSEKHAEQTYNKRIRRRRRLDGGKEQFDKQWGYETLEAITENASQHSFEKKTANMSNALERKSRTLDLKSKSTDSAPWSPNSNNNEKKWFSGVRRGSLPAAKSSCELDSEPSTPSKLANFFRNKLTSSKQSLKRTKSVTKLDRNNSNEAICPNSADNRRRRGSAALAELDGMSCTSSFDNIRSVEEDLGSTTNLKRSRSLGRLTKRWRRSSYRPKTPSTIDCQPNIDKKISVAVKKRHTFLGHLISSRIRASRSHESLLSVCSSNMQTIQLDSSDSISIKKLHSSLFGHDHCFSVTTQHGCKYYSCRNSTERDQWIKCIRKTLRPMEEHTKRKDESLSLCIQEMKKVTVKKRCFCEILLDKKLYARTSVSEKTDTYFWGENFQFNNLNDTREISIDIYREADRKKKKDKNVLIGSVQISVDELKGYGIVDRWFTATAPSISQNNSILMRQRSLDSKADFSPLIRVTAHYEEIEILPNNSYERLVRYVEQNYMKIISTFEPRITKVKDKELLASCLVRVMRKCNKSADFLAKVVLAEIRKSSNAHLTLRGNSVASKAMEKFMHLVGERYLHDTLSQFVTSIIENVDLDFEVDPTRLINPNNSLDKHQDNLKHYVDVALCKIFASLSYFPNELRQVFASMRDHLKEENKSDLVVTLMSACVFLRFICPAILSPSMHGLAKKLPGMKTRRNLTLVAKVIQNLANFSHFGTKEDYMIFFNSVVDSYMGSMRMFLDQISTNAKNADNDQLYFESDVEIGKYLSILHSLLERLFNDVKEDEDNIKDPDLKSILDDIRHELDYGIKPITQITSPTECGNRQGYPTVRSVYDNVEDDDLDKQDQNANSPIRKLVPTPVLTSTPDRNTEDVNNSWNAIVSAAQAVSGQYPDNILPPVDDEDEEESRVERASQVSAMASSGYQSLGGSSPTEPLAFHNPAFNHYRAASRSSSSSDSPKALDSLIYHHQYSHQPKRNEKSANEYENEIMKLRHQLAKAESRLASAEQQLCQQTTEKKDSEAQLKELYDKLSSMERRLKEEKKMMQGNFGQKQQQIDSQEKRLAALDAANARLLSALAHLRTPNSPEGPKLSLDYSASSSC